MSINLTKVRARINNVKRNLYYDKTLSPLLLLKVKKPLIELTDNWYMPTSLTSNFAISTEYFKLYIADLDGSLDAILQDATSAVVAGETYRITQKTRPRGATKQWSMRLELTGEN